VVGTVDKPCGRDAVDRGGALDLVMTDVSLSGDGDGMDVARAAAARGVPVLFVTAICPVDAQTIVSAAWPSLTPTRY
jgi:DNA-binding response OmpR family regulator